MVNFKPLGGNRFNVFGFTIFSFGLIFHAKCDSKIEEIEKAILDYYKYTGGIIWKWNSEEAKLASINGSSRYGEYDGLCPRGTAANVQEDPTVQDIMLESQRCTKVQMQILKCQCFKTRREDGVKVTSSTYFKFVRGPNGEVYEVSPPDDETKCDDPTTRTIKRCAHPGDFSVLDMSEVEKLILHTGGVKKWEAPESTCKLLHPHFAKIRLERLPVISESEDCAKIQMLVLKCIHMTNGIEESPDEYEGQGGYVKDIDNQVYKVQFSFSNYECKMRNVYTIRKRVIDSQNRLVQLVCPK